MFRAAGTARFAFNWGLAEYNRILDWNREHPEDKQKVSGRVLCVRFTKERPPWVTEVTAWAVQGAFADLQRAFLMFWKKSKNGTLAPSNKPRRDGRPHGWPRFKARNRTTPAFYLHNSTLRFDGHYVNFDVKRCGPVNMTEMLRFDGKILGGRVSYSGGHWWLAVQVEMDIDEPPPNNKIVGVDMGIKYLAVTSDGQVYDNPKALQAAQRKLRVLQRKLDRQRRANNPDNFNDNGTAKKGRREWVVSNKMRETEAQITKLHARIANIRNDAAHKMTTDITTNYGTIGIEDLNIRGMISNGKLSKSVADAAMYEKRRQLEYKAAFNGGVVVPVSRWFPSSKMCSGCGWLNSKLTLATRQWDCQECGQSNHRDGNAAVNIRDEVIKILTS